MPGLALYEGNLRSLLLLGADKKRLGCWRDRGNNNMEEGPSRCVAQHPSTCLRAQRACSVWYMGVCLRLVEGS